MESGDPEGTIINPKPGFQSTINNQQSTIQRGCFSIKNQKSKIKNPMGSKGFEKALEIGRPPNVRELFPNSKALIVSGKVIDRAMLTKGKAMAIAANGRNHLVIRGALRADRVPAADGRVARPLRRDSLPSTSRASRDSRTRRRGNGHSWPVRSGRPRRPSPPRSV